MIFNLKNSKLRVPFVFCWIHLQPERPLLHAARKELGSTKLSWGIVHPGIDVHFDIIIIIIFLMTTM